VEILETHGAIVVTNVAAQAGKIRYCGGKCSYPNCALLPQQISRTNQHNMLKQQ